MLLGALHVERQYLLSLKSSTRKTISNPGEEVRIRVLQRQGARAIVVPGFKETIQQLLPTLTHPNSQKIKIQQHSTIFNSIAQCPNSHQQCGTTPPVPTAPLGPFPPRLPCAAPRRSSSERGARSEEVPRLRPVSQGTSLAWWSRAVDMFV